MAQTVHLTEQERQEYAGHIAGTFVIDVKDERRIRRHVCSCTQCESWIQDLLIQVRNDHDVGDNFHTVASEPTTEDDATAQTLQVAMTRVVDPEVEAAFAEARRRLGAQITGD